MKNFFTSRAFLYAALLHVAIICLLFFSVHFSSTPISAASMPSKSPTKMVEAVVVNQTEVQQEMQKIQQERATKAQQALEQQRELQQQQAALKQQQQVAAKAKAALAAQQKALQQQQAAIAKAQQQQATKVAALQAQQQAVAKAEAATAQAAQQQAAQQALQQKLQQDQADTQAAQAAMVAKQQAAQLANTVNKYNVLILAAIHPNWIISDKQKDLSTDVLISLAPDGSVLSVQVQKSSGSTAFDNSAVAAVYKSSPLPVPSEPQAFAVFRQFKLTLHPEG